jgi:choline-sulfatase
MLGERGLWFKMSFFEGSARVPLMMGIPGRSHCTITMPVSTIDVTPTLAALAGIDLDEIQPWTDGKNLLPLIGNAASASPFLMEYAADGSIAPLVAVCDGDFKFIHSPVDPPQLFDFASNPDEMQNLADDPIYADKLAHFNDLMKARLYLETFDADVRESQARRHIVYAALRQGHCYP